MKLAIVLLLSTLAVAADAPKPVHKLTDAQKIQALLIYKAQADKLISRLNLQLKAAQEQLQAEQANSDRSLSFGIQELYNSVGAKPEEETFNFDTLTMTPVEPKKDVAKPADASAPEVKK